MGGVGWLVWGGMHEPRDGRPVNSTIPSTLKTPQVVLLGQNVNSYHDQSPEALAYSAALPSGGEYQVSEGFSNLYRSRGGKGVYFVDLLDQVRRPSTRRWWCWC